MLKLSNNAKVLAAFILPKSPGMKPHGLVLAEALNDEYVTWEIYWDGAMSESIDSFDEVWEAESGHYFQASQQGNRDLAELDFGLRLSRLLTRRMLGGVASTRIG